jgi:hypothetical protein
LEATVNKSVCFVTLVLGIASITGCGGDDDDASDAPTSAGETTSPATAAPPASTSAPSGSSSPSTTPADTSEETTAVTEPSSDSDELSPAAVAADLAESGLGCDDFAETVDDPNETDPTLAPEPEGDEGTCTVAGIPVTIGVWADEDAVEMFEAQVETIYRQYLVAFGIEEIAWVQAGPDDRIYVSAVGSDEQVQTKPTDEELAMLDDVADALDGEVHTFEP